MSMQLWWEPEPTDGGIVPDYPPMDLTPYVTDVSGFTLGDVRRCGATAEVHVDGEVWACSGSGGAEHRCRLPWTDPTVLRVRVLHRCACGAEWT